MPKQPMKRARTFKNSLAVASSVLAILLLTSCSLFSNRVVFVDAKTDVVRLGEDVKGHVFYQNEKGEWIKSGNRVKLPAGWYAGRLDK